MRYRTKSKSAQACEIPPEVKEAVWDRDHGQCIVCGTSYTASPCAQYIPRSHLGLGIEENIVTLCMACHCDYDNSPKRPYIKAQIRMYLQMRYKDWDERKLVYRKYPALDDYMELSDRGKSDVDNYIKLTKKEEEKYEQNHIDR